MKFVSLRGKTPPATLQSAITQGLATDGGLFVPQVWPALKIQNKWAHLAFHEFAALVLAPFFAEDPLAPQLTAMCARAFDFPLPLETLAEGKMILELFHGPTGAFKDFGARFLALCCAAMVEEKGLPRLVVVATSGDTGGAVAAAFSEFSKIPIAILYPKGRVSARQEKQLTVWGPKVRAFAVEGSFDDCQSLVKQALAAEWWTKRYRLISANSINLGRLLPQMAYFAYASLKYQKEQRRPADFIVPSGNMGNAAAALWARRLGFPLGQVIFAHNANAAVSKFFRDGVWSPQATVVTLANAMDVGNPSNFDRVRGLFQTTEELKSQTAAFSVTDAQIRATILEAKADWNQTVCPHTATAIFVGQKRPGHWVVAATAHPAKFETILEPLLGEVVAVPPALAKLLAKPGESFALAPHLASLQEAVGLWLPVV